jgi:transcriptional regulator with XRE-family HTH domain
MSCQDVADRLGVPVTRITRLETGSAGLRLADVEALLGLYDVPAEDRVELLTMARQSLRHTWWAQLAGQPRHWRSLQHLESSATRLRDFQLYLLPCLLRTVDYSAEVFGNGVLQRTAVEVDRLVDIQLTRQAVLDRPGGPTLHAIIDEHALPLLGWDEPMSQGQLRHLLAMSEHPNVTIQVIPTSVGLHAGMNGSFTIMDYADDTVVYTEQLVTATYYQTRSDITVYSNIMARLLSVALSPAATRDFLRGLIPGR